MDQANAQRPILGATSRRRSLLRFNQSNAKPTTADRNSAAMNQTPVKIIYVVIFSEAILAAFGVLALCLTMFFKNYAEPAVLTAIITITSSLVGSFTTILVKTGQPPQNTTTVTTPATPDVVVSATPPKVEVTASKT